MSEFLCGINPFRRKMEGDEDLSIKDRNNIANKMAKIASDWDGGTYKNVKDLNYNNPETFEWLWRKYTKLPALDPSEFPVNYKHVRRFEMGLKYYDTLLGKPKGIFASKFHLPRRAMQNMPDLQKFERNLSNETSFFRDYSNNANKNVSQFLDTFNNFALSTGDHNVISSKILGRDKKPVRKLYDEYSKLQTAYLQAGSARQKAVISKQLRENRQNLNNFYNSGSGDAFVMMNDMMQGVDISTITNKDGSKLSVKQRQSLEQMKTNYQHIRKAGALGLVRGLQKIKQMSKERDLGWTDNVIERVDGLIKAIEFQKSTDESGKTIAFNNFTSDKDFLALGFRSKDLSRNGKLGFSKHYMSQYTLGLLKTIKNLQKDVEDGRMSVSEKVINEINSWDEIVNVAKGRSPISNPVYDNDPYFFLKKYVSDVGIFNYKLHVKDNFTRASHSIIREHLNPAKEKGRTDLVESSEGMLDLIKDVYDEIQTIDPSRDNAFTNAMRTMQAVTYFRLMGGNVRSGVRNGTQRLYEWVEFGLKASRWDAPNFYKNVGQAENNRVAGTRQKKKYGLQWFDGKDKTSNIWDSIKGKDVQVSSQTRGAMEDAYMNDKDVYIDAKGELQVKDGDTWHAKTARGTSNVAKAAGTFHKVVEDWNRGKTFDIGFALASTNLRQTSDTWRSQQILRRYKNDILSKKGDDYIITKKDLVEKYGNDAEKVMDSWIENRAGELAYGGVLDLHFEYAKWNKARAIRPTGKESTPTIMAKMGLGQFAHYRFEMASLMHKWVTEAGLNPRQKIGAARAGDFASEEFLRPLRFGMLQAFIAASSVIARTNLQKLIPNDVVETLDAFQLHARVQAKLATGEIKQAQIDRIRADESGKLYESIPQGELIRDWNKATYGQGGATFLGPNAPIIMGAYELLTKANIDGMVDPRNENAFDTAYNHMKKDKPKELYDKLQMINSQLARTVAYSWPGVQGGASFADFAYMELGLFNSKPQREMAKVLYGTNKKRRTKQDILKKDKSKKDIRAAIRALNKF
jgi:hypothetical protein